ncbi:MAG: hypothetical protein SF182_21595 [Deltaproteobacteria bacterium]|nr:hypothetical protein [Deltaproteobacteria bacterium]
MRRLLLIVLAVTCLAAPLLAAEEELDPTVKHRDRSPGTALGAMAINVVYLPLRLATTFMGAELAGITGFFTAGNIDAANDVFDLVNGSQVITPKMLEGKDEFRISAY